MLKQQRISVVATTLRIFCNHFGIMSCKTESYTIKDLEHLTGIKAHTIRAWEKRYGMFNPKRNGANVRLYLKRDLELLQRIALLRQEGLKISQIAGMTRKEIDHRAVCRCKDKLIKCDHLGIVKKAIKSFNSSVVSDWIQERFDQMGVVPAMLQEIFPLKNKIRLQKLTGELNCLQEEFIEQLILRKLANEIEKAERNNRRLKEAIIYLPQGNRFEPCLLFTHYLLASKHYGVLNVGKIERASEIGQLASQRKPALIVTFLSEKFCRCSVREYVVELGHSIGNAELIVSGYQVKNFNADLPQNVRVLKNLKEIAISI